MNSYYVNVATDIGQVDSLNETDTVDTVNEIHECNSSLRYIKNNLRNEDRFMFSQVTESDICVKLKTLNKKKATGYDNITPKLIKLVLKV